MMRPLCIAVSLVVLCQPCLGGDTEMNQEQLILALIDNYVAAVNDADADGLNKLFWYEDPRFSEVENHIPTPFGKEVFLDISDWIRRNAKPGEKQRFYATSVYFLSEKVAYSVSLREEIETRKISRVTLIFLENEGRWKIIHGHFSYVPE